MNVLRIRRVGGDFGVVAPAVDAAALARSPQIRLVWGSTKPGRTVHHDASITARLRALDKRSRLGGPTNRSRPSRAASAPSSIEGIGRSLPMRRRRPAHVSNG